MTGPVAPRSVLEQLAADLDGAFEAFVQEHGRLVYGVAFRALGNRGDAEDAAQETFVRAYRALCRYDAARIRALQPRAWLARIALNCARNRRRGQDRGNASLDEALERADDADTAPHAVVERREAASHWSALLAGLPAAHRQAVELRHVHGLSYAEIAAVLDRPVGTVKVHVHRGVRQLREAHERALDAESDGTRESALPRATATLRLVSEVSR